MAQQHLAQIAIVVHDYDEAIAFYTQKLGFALIEDTPLSESKRWVVVAPHQQKGAHILLAKAVGAEQHSAIGNQTGGRVFLFLHTNDFDAYHQQLVQHNVTIVREPSQQAYGQVLVFEDLYGNKWDLIGN